MAETTPTWSFSHAGRGYRLSRGPRRGRLELAPVGRFVDALLRIRSSSLQRATENTRQFCVPGQLAVRGGKAGSIPRALRCRPREARGDVRVSPRLRGRHPGRARPTIGIGFRWLSVAPRDPVADPLTIVGICDPGLSLHKESVLPRWDDLLFHAPVERRVGRLTGRGAHGQSHAPWRPCKTLDMRAAVVEARIPRPSGVELSTSILFALSYNIQYCNDSSCPAEAGTVFVMPYDTHETLAN